jgi:hypothetical protein
MFLSVSPSPLLLATLLLLLLPLARCLRYVFVTSHSILRACILALFRFFCLFVCSVAANAPIDCRVSYGFSVVCAFIEETQRL